MNILTSAQDLISSEFFQSAILPFLVVTVGVPLFHMFIRIRD